MTKAPTPKPAAARKAAPKPDKTSPKPKTPKPAVSDDGDDDMPELRKKGLVERVAEKAGVKKKTARDVTEVVLAEIGAALSRGEALNLAPLGKVKINRQKESGSGEVIVVRIRRGGKSAGAAAQEDLAEQGD
jgi:DNA-binding protein HU-alpha